MLYRRSSRPTRVTRGSAADLEQHAADALVESGQASNLLVGVVDHRAELDHLERLAVQADALRAVEHRPLAGQLDGDGGDDHHRQRTEQHGQRHKDVERPLLELLGTAVLRLLDVDQRKSRHRLHRQPRSCDIDDTRRHHQVDAEFVQIPGQFADALWAEMVGGGQRDRVGVGLEDRVVDLALVAEHRQRADPGISMVPPVLRPVRHTPITEYP